MYLSNGDLIEYIDSFGHGIVRQGRIVRIELVDHGQDNGVSLTDVPLDLIVDGFPPLNKGFMVTMEVEGKLKWCYGQAVIGPAYEMEGHA